MISITNTARKFFIKEKSIRKAGKVAGNTGKKSFTVNDIYFKPKPSFIIRGFKRIGILADLHIPFVDSSALDIALQYLKDRQIDCLLLNGDVVDFYSVSFWERRIEYRDLNEERAYILKFFRYLRENFPDIPVFYKEGNHEERLKNFLLKHAPELFNIEELRIEKFLKLKDYDIFYISDNSIKIGKLNVIHGHEYRSYASVNIAISYLRKTLENICVAHHHRSQNDILRKIDGELIGAWVVGCLCKLSPDYQPFNQWTQGFAIVNILDKEGNFYFENKLIYGKYVF